MTFQTYLAPLLAWSFLPALGSKFLQKAWYKTFKSPPLENSYQFQLDRSRCHLIVIFLFLLYSFVSTEMSMSLSHYQVLHISPNADDRQLKSSFRALSLIHHPDKLVPGSTGQFDYVAITNAYEVLKNPTKRLAYDHFGPESFLCERCLTFKEYLMNSLSGTMIFYAVSFGMVFGQLKLEFSLRFYGYRIFCPLLEVSAVFRTDRIGIISVD